MTAMPAWSEQAIDRLADTETCPVCETTALINGRCPECAADLTGPIGQELWSASAAAIRALRARQLVIERVPIGAGIETVSLGSAQSLAAAPAGPTAIAPSVSPPARSSATVQSVLAVAGAGLFAIAAIVFTFFNPDLTDHVLRSVIVGLVTIPFLGGAWLLARRDLQFSAEAVGALGMVFVGLDVYAVSELAPTGISAWLFAALGTLVAGGIMAVAGAVRRIRTWLWVSVVALTAVPAMVGYSGHTSLTSVLGHLGAVIAAIVAIEGIQVVSRRFSSALTVEKITLTVLQLAAVAAVVLQVGAIDANSVTAYWVTVAGVLAAVAVLAGIATRRVARHAWSAIAGAAAVAAIVALPFALDLDEPEWYLALVPAAGAIVLPAFGAVIRLPSTVARSPFTVAVIVVAAISVVPSALVSLYLGVATAVASLGRASFAARMFDQSMSGAAVLGVSAMAIGLGTFAWRTSGRAPRLASAMGSLSLCLAVLAGLAFACLPEFAPWVQITIALGLAIAASLALAFLPRVRRAARALRIPAIVGAHLAVVLAGIISWTDDRLVVWAGVAIVIAIAAVATALPSRARFLYVGLGYAYGLVIFGTALDQLGVGTIALLCLTTSLGSIGAIAATFSRRVPPTSWYAILAVTSVPFVIGVVQVVFERSGWTALSTGLMFLLALALLLTRRPGLGIVLRAMAAALLVPSLAVVVVCLGAQVLIDSASPVTLPVIAAIVALVLPSTALIRTALERHGIGAREASVARIGIEASALVTGAIAVALALVRVAAGLPTTLVVFVILGIGAATTSLWAGRRYGWWVAGASFTGALWCVWALAGIELLEPYLLPPTLAAAIVGAILTARGSRAVALYGSGLLVAIVPILVALAVSGSGESATAAWRGYGLIAGAWALLGLGVLLGRRSSGWATRLRALRVPTLGGAVVAGAAGAIQGVRFGTGTDGVITGGVPLVLVCLGLGLAGALAAGLAAREIRVGAIPAGVASSRWLYAPVVVYVAVASWTAIERDWFTIWTMWALMLAYLVALVVVAIRVRAGVGGLPPVWFLFGIAFVTSIVAWSPRDLRVEWFSLPLGLFLLAAGVVTMRVNSADAAPRRTLNSWPGGWNGSWALLAPGIVVMMLASIVATFTDPQTWRAILVIVIALIAILAGASMKLAAPFLLGIIVLPVENFFVFVVQIGRGIESVPWWITLAVVGAVLLIIAVTYERRAGADNSIAARLRDLR